MNNIIEEILRVTYLRYLVSIVVYLFTLFGQSDAQWQKTGFPDTKVNALKMVDTSIYACTDGQGIFVSTDNGENWKEINEGLQSRIVHSILINGTTIFAGTETGVSVSTNSGLNWETVNSGLSGKGVWSFEADSTCDTIYIGTSSGVYYSIDKGKNWITTGLTNTTMPVHSIVKFRKCMVAASLGGGLFKSLDNGAKWNDISILSTDPETSIERMVPICSLYKVAYSSLCDVYAGSLSGLVYSLQFNTPPYEYLNEKAFFRLDYNKTNLYKPILCFASRNYRLFAGDSFGYILQKSEFYPWQLSYLPLLNMATYSLALDSSYIFAGTEKGVWRLWYPLPITGVDNIKENPSGFSLEQNYPNPFNPETTIKYSIPKIGTNDYLPVQLKVYSLLGQEIATLVNEQKAPGNYEVKFSGLNLGSGIYIYRLQAENFISAKKLILLK